MLKTEMSGVLKFYDLVSTGNGSSNASVTGRCRECGKTIKGFRNITSNFVTHLRNVHKRVYEAYDLTRPHKGSRKRRSNTFDDSGANGGEESFHNDLEAPSRPNVSEEEAATRKSSLEMDKRPRKPITKREPIGKHEAAARADNVPCALADCVAARCDDAHASIARFCVATNTPITVLKSSAFRSALHSAFTNGDPTQSTAAMCVACASLHDILAATHLRARAKVRALLSSGGAQFNVTYDIVHLPPAAWPQTHGIANRGIGEMLVGVTLNFVPLVAQVDSHLYTVTVAAARLPRDDNALAAFAHSINDRLAKLIGFGRFDASRIAASVCCDLDSVDLILRERNVSFLHTDSSQADYSEPRVFDMRRIGAIDNSAHDLTALRCFQSRVERALNEAIRVVTRNSDVFAELRRCIAVLRSVLERAHRAAVGLLYSASSMRMARMNGTTSNGDFEVLDDQAAQQNEIQLRAFVGWLKTLRVVDTAAASSRRWNAEMKMLRRLLDVNASYSALLRRVAGVDLDWLVDGLRRTDLIVTLREFVTVVQPFEEVLDVLDASGQISVSLVVPCLFGFDSHLNDVEVAVRSELNRALVRRIRANLHAEFAFVFRAFDGTGPLYGGGNDSERSVVQTLLSGTLLDPRFKATCFDETAAHKLIAVSALRAILNSRGYGHGLGQMNMNMSNVERELEEYLSEDIIAQVNDPQRVLEYWKTNSGRWPVLYRVATELLAVPATRTPFQRALTDMLLDADASSREVLDRIAYTNWNWLDMEADDQEADVEFSETKRFALKCNLALLDHGQLFASNALCAL